MSTPCAQNLLLERLAPKLTLPITTINKIDTTLFHHHLKLLILIHTSFNPAIYPLRVTSAQMQNSYEDVSPLAKKVLLLSRHEIVMAAGITKHKKEQPNEKTNIPNRITTKLIIQISRKTRASNHT